MKKSANDSCRTSSLALAISLALPAAAMARQEFLIEEVTVTAQKREQNLQHVPVSVAVVSGVAIAEAGMTNLDELSTHVPNLIITEGSQTTAITMRGLGSGINQGFEQSVGLFIDGIYAGRDRQFRSPFLDIAAVEVLRGPQGTLFGKNTIAGALNITTARPGDAFEASLRTTYEPEYNEYALEGILSGALTDNLKARLALKQAETDGYLENTFTAGDEPNRVETVVRGTLVWDTSEDLTVTAKYETARYDIGGEANRIDSDGGWSAVYLGVDPAFATGDDFARSAGQEVSENDNASFTLTVDCALGEYTLTSISGYSEYQYHDHQDVDFSPLELLTQVQDQDFDQWSQEIRLISPLGEKFDFIGGLYYQTARLKNHKRLDSDLAVIAGGVPALGSVNGMPLPVNPFSVANLLAPATFINAGGGLIPTNIAASIVAAGLDGGRSARFSEFDQDARAWAIFGQGTWHVRDDLHLTFGLRYTEEAKEASRDLDITEYGTETPLSVTDPDNALTLGIQNGVFGTFNHNLQDDFAVQNLSPSFKVQYDLDDGAMLYASASRAFKSGGFSESGTDADAAGFSFDDEQALAFELGGKLRILDGRGVVNFALFQTHYEDLQVSAFVGDRFVVGNAAEATSRGLEVDSQMRLTKDLTLTASMAYLDAGYDKFENASCTLAQIEASGTSANTCEQDLKGETLAFAPEWTANMGLGHVTGLTQDLELRSHLNINYVGEHYLAQDLDARTLEEDHITVNARVALTGVSSFWELALIGKNLTDASIRTYANDVPLMNGAYFTYMALPRTMAVQFSLAY